MPPATDLLEREHELTELDALVDRTVAGIGGGAVVEGPPGQGKTALLRTVRALAAEAGARVLTASGSDLERDVPFGLVRQLLEPELRRADDDRRARLLDGAAGLALPALEPRDAPGADADASHVRLHGLFWLCANLADEGPLVLVVDDAQWADAPSIRWFEYLARRIEDVGVALVIASRPPADGPVRDGLDLLAGMPAVVTLTPAPLGADAVAELLADGLGRAPETAFRDACAQTTGGNPMLVRELVRALTAERFAGREAEADAARRLVPGSIARAVGLRLRALAPEAVALARAVAVLGDGRPARIAAALARVAPADVAAAHAALAGAAILDRDALAFAHPLIREVVLDGFVGTERAAWHDRAADLLHAEDAPAAELVAHVLAAEPRASAWRTEALTAVAHDALTGGAPDTAVRLLERALREPAADALVPEILLALGTAQARVGDPAGLDRLAQAGATGGPDVAVAAERERMGLLVMRGRAGDAAAGLRALADRLRDDRPDLAEQAEADLLDVLLYEPGGLAELRERLAAGAGRGDVRALALHAFDRAGQGAPASEVAALARRALAGGRLLADQGADRFGFLYAVEALMLAERPDEAASALEQVTALARRAGSPVTAGMLALMRSPWERRFGDVRRAEAEARRPGELLGERSPHERAAAVALASALLDQGRIEEAEAAMAPLARGEPDLSIHGEHAVLGRLRLEQRRFSEALAELELARDIEARRGWVVTTREDRGPLMVAVLARLDRREEARALAAEEIERARRREAPAAQALVVGALASAHDDEEALALLHEAVGLAQASRSPFVRAQTQFELGAALRRANQRVDARTVLRDAREAASRCGATALEQRAYDELVIAGGRPRSKHSTGVESLTPSELRTAELAAGGLSNREIAETLFVTRKTVEAQLGSTYAKLGIQTRGQLPELLGPR